MDTQGTPLAETQPLDEGEKAEPIIDGRCIAQSQFGYVVAGFLWSAA
jgi:hypothetical protein